MAPFRRQAVPRSAGHATIAIAVALHLAVAVLVDCIATVLHLPADLRIVLTTCCLVGHWHVHVRLH